MAIRSRLVATEVRRRGMESIFAAAPPLDSRQALCMKAASRRGGTGASLGMQLIDVSRAHFYAEAQRDVFIHLPPEDSRAEEPGVVGHLAKTMYGTLDAAEQWARH